MGPGETHHLSVGIKLHASLPFCTRQTGLTPRKIRLATKGFNRQIRHNDSEGNSCIKKKLKSWSDEIERGENVRVLLPLPSDRILCKQIDSRGLKRGEKRKMSQRSPLEIRLRVGIQGHEINDLFPLQMPFGFASNFEEIA